jgi:hypothetical protein
LHFSLFPTKIDFPAVEKILEKFYIDEAYKMARGNESKAVQLLNVDHHTHRCRKIKIFKITLPNPKY